MVFKAFVKSLEWPKGNWVYADDEMGLRQIEQLYDDVVEYHVSGTTHSPLVASGCVQIARREAASSAVKKRGWGVRGSHMFLCRGTDLNEVLAVRDVLI